MTYFIPIALSFIGLIVATLSGSKLVARLKPTQAAGIAAGLTLAVLPWLKPREYSAFGISYKVTEVAKIQEVTATDAQFKALGQRLAALENLVALSRNPAATPAQQKAAELGSETAQHNYSVAAGAATRARRRYVQQVDRGTDTPPACGLRRDGSIAMHDVPDPSFGEVTVACDTDGPPRIVPVPDAFSHPQ